MKPRPRFEFEGRGGKSYESAKSISWESLFVGEGDACVFNSSHVDFVCAFLSMEAVFLLMVAVLLLVVAAFLFELGGFLSVLGVFLLLVGVFLLLVGVFLLVVGVFLLVARVFVLVVSRFLLEGGGDGKSVSSSKLNSSVKSCDSLRIRLFSLSSFAVVSDDFMTEYISRTSSGVIPGSKRLASTNPTCWNSLKAFYW